MLTIEEQRMRDEDAVYDRYLEDDPDEAPEPSLCEWPGCDVEAVGDVQVDVIEGEPLYCCYCADHIGGRT